MLPAPLSKRTVADRHRLATIVTSTADDHSCMTTMADVPTSMTLDDRTQNRGSLMLSRVLWVLAQVYCYFMQTSSGKWHQVRIPVFFWRWNKWC